MCTIVPRFTATNVSRVLVGYIIVSLRSKFHRTLSNGSYLTLELLVYLGPQTNLFASIWNNIKKYRKGDSGDTTHGNCSMIEQSQYEFYQAPVDFHCQYKTLIIFRDKARRQSNSLNNAVLQAQSPGNRKRLQKDEVISLCFVK